MQAEKVGGMLKVICFVTLFFWQGRSESGINFKFCGTWRHGNRPRSLISDVVPGCGNVSISANESTLSIKGELTSKCVPPKVHPLCPTLFQKTSHFCVFWEPAWDLLQVELNGQNFTLCEPQFQTSWCGDISPGPQNSSSYYGILNGTIKDDRITESPHDTYWFTGFKGNCSTVEGKNYCDSENMKGPRMGQGHKNLSCSESVVVEMEEGFGGSNVTLPAPQKQKRKVNPSVYLPPALKPSGRKRSKVFCTYLPNSTFSQRGPSTSRILEDVVEISVENEIIQNLTDPVRIRFHHHDISVEESVSCVSWDTRKDANEIIWRKDGCRTVKISSTETECCCHHLTYFAILVQIEQRSTVRHLQALTFITAVCCAVSLFSCSILLLSLCRQRNGKDKSLSVHYGLVLALFMLNLFFILTGVLASAGSEGVCRATGALLHYALLCTICWMAIEVFHAFWLVYMVFSTSPNPKIFYFVGFGIPALIVSILGFSLDIYGQRKIVPNEDINNPYQMCWLKYSDAGLLTHYIANVAPLIGLMCCGFIMLCLVVRKVKDRDEWRKNRTAFLSIWGLCCLFGITWSLIFLDFGLLSDTILFLFCIINALQGFFLMLRYYVLERIRKRTSELEQSSTGSTRQHMLQTQEKS